jgi:hypothetical protein
MRFFGQFLPLSCDFFPMSAFGIFGAAIADVAGDKVRYVVLLFLFQINWESFLLRPAAFDAANP